MPAFNPRASRAANDTMPGHGPAAEALREAHAHVLEDGHEAARETLASALYHGMGGDEQAMSDAAALSIASVTAEGPATQALVGAQVFSVAAKPAMTTAQLLHAAATGPAFAPAQLLHAAATGPAFAPAQLLHAAATGPTFAPDPLTLPDHPPPPPALLPHAPSPAPASQATAALVQGGALIALPGSRGGAGGSEGAAAPAPEPSAPPPALTNQVRTYYVHFYTQLGLSRGVLQ